MPISVGDAVLKITGDSANLDKELEKVDGKVKSSTDNMAKNFRMAGAAVTAFGAVITGILAMSVKAAANEEAGIKRLEIAMSNVGLAYDGANGELEKWIDNMQQATAVADDQMREALSGLVVVTKDLTKAQELLTIALDVARWKNIDLKTATDLVMKVYAGDMGLLKRYGIIVAENATNIEALAEIQKMAAGQAEAYGKTVEGQMELLKNNLGDVAEAIGSALLPKLNALFDKLNPMIQGLKKWIAEHPKLTTAIVTGTAALGLFAAVLGPILFMLPNIITGFNMVKGAIIGLHLVTKIQTALQWAWNAAMLANPIGLIIAGIMALIAAGVALYLNWEKIVRFFKGEAKDSVKELSDSIRKASDDMVADAEQATQTAISNAQLVAETEKQRLAERVSYYRDMHYEKLDMIEEEMIAELEAIDPVLAAELKSYNEQIAALDERKKAREEATEEDRISSLEQQLLDSTLSAERRNAIERELESLEDARVKEQLLEERNRKIKDANVDKYYEGQANKQDELLKSQIKKYESDFAAFKSLNDDKLEDTGRFVSEYNRIMGNLEANPKYTITHEGLQGVEEKPWFQFWQHGGVIREPTLLYGLQSRMPYAVAGEAGPETVSPMGSSEGNTITININNPSVRSDNDITEIARQVSDVLYDMQRTEMRLAGA